MEMIELMIEEIKHETDAAILVLYQDEEYWLSKSQIEYRGEVGDRDIEIEVPEWLAIEKEII